jgi:S-adenosylmethionine decarboxylase
VFFEGPEKKFEIILKPGAPSLRSELFDWDTVVADARTEVLSSISNDKCDAYLLSESSLFVFDDRAIMITCGKTTLVLGAMQALKQIDIDKLEWFFYERKNEHRPEYQHSNFFQDVNMIQETLPGKAFRFGQEDTHHIHLFHTEKGSSDPCDDNTLELLMHGIDPKAARFFTTDKYQNTNDVRSDTKIDQVFPDFQVDDYLFDPVGYSLNAIKDEAYYTFHVTPQKNTSYVSFETNACAPEDIEKCLAKVLNIFRPRSCDVMYFHHESLDIAFDVDYQIQRRIIEPLSCGYTVHFSTLFNPHPDVQRAISLDPRKEKP